MIKLICYKRTQKNTSNKNKYKIKNFKFNFINSLIITTLLSASYFYGIGRERYLVNSEFAIRASGPSNLIQDSQVYLQEPIEVQEKMEDILWFI